MNAEQARKAERMAEYSKLTRGFKSGALVVLLVPVSLILLLLLALVIWRGYVTSGKTELCTYETAAGRTVTVTQLGHRDALVDFDTLLISVDGEPYLKVTVETSSKTPIYPSERITFTDSGDAVTLKIDDLGTEVRFAPDFSGIQFIRSVSYTPIKKDLPVAAHQPIDLH